MNKKTQGVVESFLNGNIKQAKDYFRARPSELVHAYRYIVANVDKKLATGDRFISLMRWK